MATIEIPSDLKRNIGRLGSPKADAWLKSVPDLVADLSSLWELTDVRPFERQSFNFTAICTQQGGRRAVLKLGFPSGEDVIAKQAQMLSHFKGNCAAELFEFDRDYDAILMEALEPGQTLVIAFPNDPKRAVAVGLKVLRGLPRDVPVSFAVPNLAEWFEVLDSESSRVVPEEILERAGSELKRLLKQPSMLLHGDFHHGNILSSGAGFKVIDPECARGPVGYDAAVFLNDHNRWLLGKEDETAEMDYAIEAFSSAAGLPKPVICKWALCQIVLCMCWDAEDFGRFEGHDLAIALRWLDRIDG